LASLSLRLLAVLGSVLRLCQSEMPGASSLVSLLVSLLDVLQGVLVPLLALQGVLVPLLDALLVPLLDALLVPQGVLQLSYYQFAAVVVGLVDTLSGLLFHSAAGDSVASEIGKHHFLAWADLSQCAELVRDGYPQAFEHLESRAELVCRPPGWYAELYRSYCWYCVHFLQDVVQKHLECYSAGS